MTPERWGAVKRVVQEALDRPSADRPAFVDAACATDPALRHDVNALLAAADSQAGDAGRADVLARPALAVLGATRPGHTSDYALTDDPDDGLALAAQLSAALAPQFFLEHEVGRGGMAIVYRARDLRHDRSVAIKVLRPELSAMLGAARFRRETRLAARLQHPHIVPVLDSGQAAGHLWFAMPYVDGESLRQRMDRTGPLPVAEAVHLAREAAQALDYAHRRGVVHRDVKPENILLSDGHALIADFGIAKALNSAFDGDPDGSVPSRSTGVRTRTGFVVGTRLYMSPEQAVGDRALDARTDIYALGRVLYEMCVGTAALASPAAAALTARRFTGGLPPPSAARPEVPPALDAVVARAVRPDPEDRFPTAAAFAEALAVAMATPAGAVPPSARDNALPIGRAASVDRAAEPASSGRSMSRRRFGAPAQVIGAVAVLAVTALAALGVRLPGWTVPAPSLDANRVVVFPLSAPGSLPAGTGDEAATWLGVALDNTPPLRLLDATDVLGAAGPRDARALTARERNALSADQRAGFYIDGAVMRRGDSVSVVLKLHSVAGDSLVARRSASARVGSIAVPDVALRALSALLVPLLEPGRSVDVAALQDRAPGAMADFLAGEREYRASHFARALGHYRAALGRDSLFALAALKGAQCASWLEDEDASASLLRLALARVNSLPPHRAAFARGIDAYLSGAADSALAEFDRAIAFDSSRAEPWMALGEVYRHLLPRATGLDSLAERAFTRAWLADTTFTPPLYHLAELALRRGAVARADTFARAYGRADRDVGLRGTLDIVLRCARDGVHSVAWPSVVRGAPTDVAVEAGVLLADRAAYQPCAATLFSTVLARPAVIGDHSWAALYAYNYLLVSSGRDTEAVQLLHSPAAHAIHAENLLLLDAAAGAPVGDAAATVAHRFGEDYRALTPYKLWLLAQWESARGRGDRVRAIARALAEKAAASRRRADGVMARAVAARATLAGGDTARAVRQLRALLPTAPRQDLAWYAWESFGGERLLLAQVLWARHDAAGADSVAATLDESHPLANLLYQRQARRLVHETVIAAGPAR